MTKSKRQKKANKGDFKKTKIKIGKKLKPPQNETRTDFKTRKIIFKEQLAEKESSSLTRKSLNLKTVLRNSSHHNSYVRQDSLNELKSVVQFNELEKLIPDLSSIIEGVAPLIYDSDKLIRASTFKLLELLIVKVDKHFHPYFSILASHLSCAKVHMNIPIQTDSITLMDILVKRLPSLVLNARALQENFMSLVLRKMSHPEKSTVGVKSVKSFLGFNFNVLQALENFLNIEKAIEDTSGNFNNLSTNWNIIVKGSFSCIEINDSKLGGKLFPEVSGAKTFLTKLSPLLFQMLEESCQSGSQLSPSYDILTCALHIILQLWKLLKCFVEDESDKDNWVINSLKNSLKKIITNFPYTPKTNQQKEEISANDLNLLVASVGCQLFKKDKEFATKVVSFLSKLLQKETSRGQFQMCVAVDILSSILKKEKFLSIGLCKKVLASASASYSKASLKDKQHLRSLLLNLLSRECIYLWRLPSFQHWMNAIVLEAATSSSDAALLNVILQLKLHNVPGFKDIMHRHQASLKESFKESTRDFVVVL